MPTKSSDRWASERWERAEALAESLRGKLVGWGRKEQLLILLPYATRIVELEEALSSLVAEVEREYGPQPEVAALVAARQALGSER
jgi:hypothetical protein